MSVTINAFPPLHAFTSARSWFLAIIILLHVGFFWVLSSGMSQSLVSFVTKPFVVSLPEDTKTDPPPPPPKEIEVDLPRPQIIATAQPPDVIYEEKDDRIQGDPPPSHPVAPPTGPTVQTRATVMTQPQIDPRRGLSEPVYPAQSIRQNHAGTVLLSVLVLENGRVGDVRLEQSSGHQALDDSALREARKWRLKPGMRDGTPVAMWKQIPITFQLRN